MSNIINIIDFFIVSTDSYDQILEQIGVIVYGKDTNYAIGYFLINLIAIITIYLFIAAAIYFINKLFKKPSGGYLL